MAMVALRCAVQAADDDSPPSRFTFMFVRVAEARSSPSNLCRPLCRMAMVALQRALQTADAEGSPSANGLVVHGTAKVRPHWRHLSCDAFPHGVSHRTTQEGGSTSRTTFTLCNLFDHPFCNLFDAWPVWCNLAGECSCSRVSSRAHFFSSLHQPAHMRFLLCTQAIAKPETCASGTAAV